MTRGSSDRFNVWSGGGTYPIQANLRAGNDLDLNPRASVTLDKIENDMRATVNRDCRM